MRDFLLCFSNVSGLKMDNTPVNAAVVEQAAFRLGMTKREYIRQIFVDTCVKHRIAAAEVMSKSRRRAAAYCRMEIAYRIRTDLHLSFPHIGKLLARDHTSILYMVNKVEAHIKHQPWPVIDPDAQFELGEVKIGDLSDFVYSKPVPPSKLKPSSQTRLRVSAPVKKQIDAINRYWANKGFKANARAVKVGRGYKIKSDLSAVMG